VTVPAPGLMVLQALSRGALTASSLVLGAGPGVARPWRDDVVGLVLGIGAGALISALSFELASEGLREAGYGLLAVGLAVGALTFFLLDGAVDRFAQRAGAGGAATRWWSARFSTAFARCSCRGFSSPAARG
jgi:ZIP family zinc transporter